MFRVLLRRLRGRGDDQRPSTDGEGDSSSDEAVVRDEQSEEDDQYVWDLIPSWQYDGRHVESGGQTTKEQERALEDIQRQADAIEAQEAADAHQPPDEP